MFIGLVTAGVITVSIVVTLSHLSENYGYNRLGLLVRALIPLTTIGAIAYIIYALWGLFL
ncbi:hypothetical protein SPD48_14555 [Pseudogracilibacillus sp. SE30717A]|uniref:hypothetical protein n=1 Tax=Pseudogracilibacillus sp. SE30717A TaxID=3098293 RepID=UPI00300DC92C